GQAPRYGISAGGGFPARRAVASLQPRDLGIGRLFWTIREAVIVGDVEGGRIVLWNPAAEAIFGYTEAEAIGQPIEMLIPDDLRTRHRAGLARYRRTGRGAL